MEHVLIIAEAGVNHNGNIQIAEKMVEEAFRAGADIIKFQTSNPELVYSKHAIKAEYQKNTTDPTESAIDMSRGFHLEPEDFVRLKHKCNEIGICFLSTPFDLKSIEFLNTLGIPFWKIPSGEVTNYPYLVAIAKTKKPVVMSTGMCDLKTIGDAIKVLSDNGSEQIRLLHCNTEYPTPFEDVNLRAMDTMKSAFGLDVGYSDHTRGIEVPIAAVAMGAKIIEKHFTLDRTMKGPDHKASLEPNELSEMVESIRNIEKAIGTGDKNISKSESKNIAIARKSIVAQKKINKGEIITDSMITTKRPGTGISPMMWNSVIGTAAIKDFDLDDLIEI